MSAIWHQCVQGSDEWHALRLGKITGSRFGDVLAKGRAGDSFGATAEAYAIEILCERFTGIAQDQLKLRETEWGKEHESAARLAYCLFAGVSIDQVGFAVHGTMHDVGVSVDGLVGKRGLIEIKCPFNSRNHLKVMKHRRVPSEYRPQVQGGLWVLERDWTDFVSYDPRMPAEFSLCVIRVERDEEYIEALEERCRSFMSFIDNYHTALAKAQAINV